MISSYFKVALPFAASRASGEYVSTPRRDPHRELPPTAGVFPFDSRDLASVRQAFDDATTMKLSLDAKGIHSFLSVWKRPAMAGKWSNVWKIGESSTPPLGTLECNS